MGEPLTRDDLGAAPGEGPVADSARRLERALASLEASLKRAVAATPPHDDAAADPAVLVELEALRVREHELEAAAAVASQALGRAMTEVEGVLAADAASQGELDFALETDGPLADDEADAAGEPPEKDPAG